MTHDDLQDEVLTEAVIAVQQAIERLHDLQAGGLIVSAVQRGESALLDALAMARRHRAPELEAEDVAIQRAERAGDIAEVERLLRLKEARARDVIKGEGFAVAPARREKQ
jgi:hypothetical protein